MIGLSYATFTQWSMCESTAHTDLSILPGFKTKCILEGGRAGVQGLERQILAANTYSEHSMAGILDCPIRIWYSYFVFADSYLSR